MANVYCVNDNLLQSKLQTSGAHTAFKNVVYKQTSRIAKDMHFSDIWWSTDKTVGGKEMAHKFGQVDLNIEFHELKGYYQGEDNEGVPVSFEILLKS